MTEEITQLVQLTGLGLTMLLPLANPLTAMTMLLSMGQSMPQAELHRQLRQGAFYVVLIILVTYFVGTWVIHALDISLPGIRIAGGMIVAFIGFNMLFPAPTTANVPSSAGPASEASKPQDVPNIAFVPLALPGTAGPGTIAMIISASSKLSSLRAHNADWVLIASPIIIALFFGALFYICLRSADRLASLIGHGGIDAISRIMGFLLVCMGVQLVIDGILEIVHNGAM
jgi:multiple antibiotic resistance protein